MFLYMQIKDLILLPHFYIIPLRALELWYCCQKKQPRNASGDWIPGEISASGEVEFCWRDTSRNSQTWQTQQKEGNWLMGGTVYSLYQQQLSWSWWHRRGPGWEDHNWGL